MMLFTVVEAIFHVKNMLGYSDIITHEKYSTVHGWMEAMRTLHAVKITSIATDKFEAFMKTYQAHNPQYDM